MLDLAGSHALVAGGAGFIGGHLVRRLRAMGAQVRATWHNQRPAMDDGEVDWVHADLRLPGDCARVVEGIDYVFLAAANTQGAAVIAHAPLSHVGPNVAINTNLLEAAYEERVRKFLFLSSGAAYPPTDHPVTEDEMFRAEPADVYYAVAWMKRYAEILCRTYAEKISDPMPTVVIRPSNVYGPHDKFDLRTSHVTAAQIRRVAERQQPIQVWGSGLDERDLIYIDEFVDGLIAAFRTELPFLALNICSGRDVSVRQILDAAIAVDGFADAEVVYDAAKPRTIARRPMSNAKARDLLGFEAKVTLEEGIRRTLAWLRANPWALAS